MGGVHIHTHIFVHTYIHSDTYTQVFYLERKQTKESKTTTLTWGQSNVGALDGRKHRRDSRKSPCKEKRELNQARGAHIRYTGVLRTRQPRTAVLHPCVFNSLHTCLDRSTFTISMASVRSMYCESSGEAKNENREI